MNTLLLLSMPGGGEMIWIALIIIVLFGAKKIPGLMGGIGKGIKEFKDAKEGKDTDTDK
ncbi:Sec-independent protein translocase subunit TatA/TatB [Polluticoccus soli]|uniref:Sec-independent protein translocase subunit TatA/TatB n=1 Tax=Polluticoccus soli TaxID=3034150 RepID=UPI0023E2FCF5|nr:twin-arginine translocase TatA/TatE family subunit [Flavipsychrobacter sp. JY13-12]